MKWPWTLSNTFGVLDDNFKINLLIMQDGSTQRSMCFGGKKIKYLGMIIKCIHYFGLCLLENYRGDN